MNMSILSAFPAAPQSDTSSDVSAPAARRPASSSTKPKVDLEDAPVDEAQSMGNSAKAEAFGEMLAAMISVAVPPVETPVETSEVAASATMTAIASDVPRDGAGSPLFGARFAQSAATPMSVETTTSTITTSSVATAVGDSGSDGVSSTDFATTLSGTAVSDEAAAEIAQAVAQQPESAEAPIETIGDLEPALEAAPATVDSSVDESSMTLPVVSASSTTTGRETLPAAPAEPAPAVATPVSETPRSESGEPSSEIVASPVPTNAAPDAKSLENRGAESALPTATSDSEAHPAPRQGAVEPAVAEQPLPVEQPEVSSLSEEVETAESPRSTSTTPRVGSPTKSTADPLVPRSSALDPLFVAPMDMGSVVTAVTAEAGVTERDVLREQPVIDAADLVQTATAAEVDAAAGIVALPTENAAGAGAAFTVPATFSDSASAATPAHVSQQVLQALAAYEAELPSGGSRSFELLLDPPELGRLLVQMSRTSKGVDVRIAAEDGNVRSLLEAGGADLQQSLQLSSFDLGQFNDPSSNGSFFGADEWISAPSLQSFATPGAVAPSVAKSTTTSAVDVIV